MSGKYPTNVAKRSIEGAGKSDEQCAQESNALKPAGMSDLEVAVWDRICVLLIQEGRMKALYIDSLREYCHVTARMSEITCDLAKNGRTYTTKGRNGKQKKNKPAIAERNELFRQWNSLVAQWGLSPAVELRFQNAQMGLPLGAAGGDWDAFPDS